MGSQRYDVLFAPSTIVGYPQYLYVLQRAIPHESRTSALLKYFRDEYDVQIDPLDMYGASIEPAMDCGCEVWIKFSPQKVGKLRSLFSSEKVVPIANFSREVCRTHRRDDEPFELGEWEGVIVAWTHDPKRPDKFASPMHTP